jgi:hypothetical protein
LGFQTGWSFKLGISSFSGAIYQQSSSFSGAVAGEEVEDFCEGSFRTHILYFVYCFALLHFILLASFYQKPKKIRILGSCYFFTLFYYVVP